MSKLRLSLQQNIIIYKLAVVFQCIDLNSIGLNFKQRHFIIMKYRTLSIILLMIFTGTGCNKKDNAALQSTEKSSASPADVAESIQMGNDPNTKFTAPHTTINSFEHSNTHNNYGFAYVYERRSGDGQTHFYKSIQEFNQNNFSNQRNVLTETWVEISEQEWLKTKQHYEQTGELVDLTPKILQSTAIFVKYQQFLQQQQALQAQFNKERAEFDAEFKRRQAEFDRNWNEPLPPTSQSSKIKKSSDEVEQTKQEEIPKPSVEQTENQDLSTEITDSTN